VERDSNYRMGKKNPGEGGKKRKKSQDRGGHGEEDFIHTKCKAPEKKRERVKKEVEKQEKTKVSPNVYIKN